MMMVLSVHHQPKPSRFYLTVAQSALSQTPPYQPTVPVSTVFTALSLLCTLSCNKQSLAAVSKDKSRVRTTTAINMKGSLASCSLPRDRMYFYLIG